MTKSGKKEWGPNLYPGIVAGHIDPSPFMVLCKEHRAMCTSRRGWYPFAPKPKQKLEQKLTVEELLSMIERYSRDKSVTEDLKQDPSGEGRERKQGT